MPGIIDLSYGLYVCPKVLLCVFHHMSSSGTLVIQTGIAPASLMYLTTGASSVALISFLAGQPAQNNIPLMGTLSLPEKGMPKSG